MDKRPTIIIQQAGHFEGGQRVQDEAEKLGWRLFNVQASGNLIPLGLNPAGALINTGLQHSLTKMIIEKGIPFVRVGNFPKYYAQGMSSVMIDQAECGAVAARYFGRRGFANLGFVGSDPWGGGKLVYDRYVAEAEKMGCKTHLFRFQSRPEAKSAETKAEIFLERGRDLCHWVKSLQMPLALMTFSEVFGMRVCNHLLEGGIKIPEEVAVISVGNNTFFSETSPVPLSSIELPWESLWTSAFDYLHGMIEGTREPGEQVLVAPKTVVERRSTDVVQIEDPLVRVGMEMIWEQFHQNISVEDLMAKAKVSRSTVQRAFKGTLNRGFNELLREKRLEVANRLLVNTDFSITEISHQVGFNSRNYFHKTFLEEFGKTPSEFRKEIRKK